MNYVIGIIFILVLFVLAAWIDKKLEGIRLIKYINGEAENSYDKDHMW